MTAEIKVLHSRDGIARNGKPFKVNYCIIVIDGVEFFRKFYTFGK